jgi:F-type H+-transporting ATPase subunit delta
MKATATQYAKTLYELTKDKNHQEIDGVISNFIKKLNKNGQLKIAQNVIRKFQEVYNQENGIVEVEIVSKEKLNSQLVDKLISFVNDKYRAKEVLVNNVVDENIKGGIIVKVGNEVMDGSVERRLSELKKELEK